MEVVPGLWRFEAIHPEWEPGDDWHPAVAWWAVGTPTGLVLIDPLVDNWAGLDALVETAGGCAAILRTCWWHERSVAAARDRYHAGVWAREASPGGPPRHLDHPVSDGGLLPGDLQGFDVVRDDEMAVWLPRQRAVVFGDVMVRDGDGTLSMCPESWIARAGGYPVLRAALEKLRALDVQHVLVSHGPLVLDDGHLALARAVRSTRARRDLPSSAT